MDKEFSKYKNELSKKIESWEKLFEELNRKGVRELPAQKLMLASDVKVDLRELRGELEVALERCDDLVKARQVLQK